MHVIFGIIIIIIITGALSLLIYGIKTFFSSINESFTDVNKLILSGEEIINNVDCGIKDITLTQTKCFFDNDIIKSCLDKPENCVSGIVGDIVSDSLDTVLGEGTFKNITDRFNCVGRSIENGTDIGIIKIPDVVMMGECLTSTDPLNVTPSANFTNFIDNSMKNIIDTAIDAGEDVGEAVMESVEDVIDVTDTGIQAINDYWTCVGSGRNIWDCIQEFG